MRCVCSTGRLSGGEISLSLGFPSLFWYNDNMRKCLRWIAFIVMVLLVVAVVYNWQWISDYARGLSYHPIGEMGRIMSELGLTDRGESLFKAVQPTLSSRDEFNEKCRTVMDDEVAVLGCYVGDNVYVYNIDSAELAGIRELTAAHELLHAVWARMSDEEKEEMSGELKKVLSGAQYLDDELEIYDAGQRQEELFVRAGTEVAKLPDALEEKYAEVFSDQDRIVAFYDKYIAVFRAMEAEMDQLMVEMKDIETRINELMTEYEQRFAQLEADVESFNSCAEVAGCFGSEGEFYARRSALVAEQDALEIMYDEINGLIDNYNTKVERYNTDVTRTEKLNRMINSNTRPEEL